MRHVRILGLCLVAALLMSAIGAGSALAKKSPYGAGTWAQYKGCPYENPEIEWCVAGITTGGAQGGYFEYGRVKVKLDQPITLQGGFKGEYDALEVSPAANGYESLEAPELKVTGGIGLFNKRVQEVNEWPAALVESWKEAKKNHENNVYVKIEMAGNECFEVPGCLNTTNLLFEEGTAFRLALKVKITAPWLEKLDSGPCYIGSDEHPIHINLTSGGSGSAGFLEHDEEFSNIVLRDSRLADVDWTIEEASKAKGCGGAYESYIDSSLNEVLEAYSGKTGIVVLKGSLFTGYRESVATEGLESGEL